MLYMNFKTQFLELKAFLAPYQKVWNYEIMDSYPNHMDGHNKDWTEALFDLDDESLMDIAGRKIPPQLKNSQFIEFIEQVQRLTSIPINKSPDNSQVDSIGWSKIGGKKQHEITQLEKIIPQLIKDNDLRHLVDIGGGQGFLAQCLSNYYGINTISIDTDKCLQESGAIRNKKYHRQTMPMVEYINHHFAGDAIEVREYFTNNVLSLGLHTCGNLAVRHLECSIKNHSKVIFNFGCCYPKLNNEYNISTYAQVNQPLEFSIPALTLATRSHARMSTCALEQKIRVKRFRYTFHLFQIHKMEYPEFLTLGNTHHSIYNQDFATYARQQFQRIDLLQRKGSEFSDKQLNDFYNDRQIQFTVRQMILQGVFRDLFGRVIEQYLLTDRAIFLEEHNYQVTMAQYFDEEISPRNIGVLGRLLAH